MVTDASGNVGLNGLHTVTNGDDSCYGVAPTITVGSAPTTLSYTPPSSSSSTRTTDSNTRGSQTATVLANTASQALTSVFTLANGSSTTLVLDPGESVSVPIIASANNESKPQNLAVIVGSVVGAVAVIVIAVLIFFLMRSQKKQKKLVQQQQESYEQRRQNAAPYQIGAAQVNPMMLTHNPNNPHSPGRDTAPLMNPTNSTYSSGAPTTPFVGTPGPGTPSINYFNMNPAAAPWANPEANIHPMTGPAFLRNSAHSPAPTVTTLAPMSEGLPPGAMPPVPIMASNSKSVNPVLMSTPMQPTKASYASSLPVSGEPSAPAPPPYTQRQ
ncbi:hypothetical protein FRC14_004381 [Serendipita sp. 396]|nr:hypothetical protein FRC14_004381 [Serendipita sp. 396]KAG8767483.1 hypothetical protein FRC15_005650 [Serendipita sp. 397]KAG8802223.1 hypothetical protein FRC18_007608 [Serendipita sp. 400]